MKNKIIEIKAGGVAFILIVTAFLAVFMSAAVADPTIVTDVYKSDASDLWWAGASDEDIDGYEYIVPPDDAIWSNAVNCWEHSSWNSMLNPADRKAKLFAAPSADWIWKTYQVTVGESYTGDIVFFKKLIEIPDNAFNIEADFLVMTVDNGYYFYVNDDWSGTTLGQAGFMSGYGPTDFYYASDGTNLGGGTNSVTYETDGNLYPYEAAINTASSEWSSIEQWDISSELTTGENWLQIVAINEHAPPEGQTGNPGGLIYKVEVTYELATIEKTVTPDNGYLSDILTVELDVEVPTGYTMTVEDHLPTFLKYVPGTFEVDDVPVIPTVTDGIISTVVGEGDHIITFDVQIIQVEAVDYGEDNWAYLLYDDETVAEDNVWVNTYPYEGFNKYACLILWGPEDDTYIDLNEDVYWKFNIIVENIYDYTITDVVITDRLAAELEIDYVDDVSKGTFSYTTKGNVKMTWTIGELAPGEEAQLILEISTAMNKKWQEYTSPGTYEINSGAVVKFVGLNDFQYSAHTDQILFDVPDYWPYCTHGGWCCPDIDGTSDHIQVLDYIPSNVRVGQLESSDVQVWKEFEGELPVNLYCDLDEERNAVDNGPPDYDIIINEGTRVCVFYVHFDGVGGGAISYSDLSITFGAEILGVIISGGNLGTFANRNLMFDADEIFDDYTGTIYPIQSGNDYWRGYDVNHPGNIDDAEFNDATIHFDTYVSNAHDSMRVIVQMVWCV
jgi:hypothetical protein